MSDIDTSGAAETSKKSPQTIDQVKELLFGSEQRGLEQRIKALESELKDAKIAFAEEIKRIESAAAKQSEAEKQELSAVIESLGSLFLAAGKDIAKLAK